MTFVARSRTTLAGLRPGELNELVGMFEIQNDGFPDLRVADIAVLACWSHDGPRMVTITLPIHARMM